MTRKEIVKQIMEKVSAMEPNSELMIPEYSIRIERKETVFYIHGSTEMHWCYNTKSVESHIHKIIKTKMEQNSMVNIFAETNNIQDEINKMPVNTEKHFELYNIRIVKTDKKTTIEANGESHFSENPTTLRPYIWDAVKLAADKMAKKARR